MTSSLKYILYNVWGKCRQLHFTKTENSIIYGHSLYNFQNIFTSLSSHYMISREVTLKRHISLISSFLPLSPTQNSPLFNNQCWTYSSMINGHQLWLFGFKTLHCILYGNRNGKVKIFQGGLKQLSQVSFCQRMDCHLRY